MENLTDSFESKIRRLEMKMKDSEDELAWKTLSLKEANEKLDDFSDKLHASEATEIDLKNQLNSKHDEIVALNEVVVNMKGLLDERQTSKLELEKELHNLIKLKSCVQQLKIVDKAMQVSILSKVYSLVNSISEKTYIKAMTIEATKLVPEKYVDMLQAVITKTDDVACNYWEKFMF